MGILVTVVGGFQQARVVLVGGLGDQLLERDVPADPVSRFGQQSVDHYACYASVPVVEGMDGQQIQDEQPDQQNRVVIPASRAAT